MFVVAMGAVFVGGARILCNQRSRHIDARDLSYHVNTFRSGEIVRCGAVCALLGQY